jgi:pimeloyl-ACP methyl ester carboxylesterase
MHFIGVLIKAALCGIILVTFLYSFLTHFILWVELRLLTLTSSPKQIKAVIVPPWSKLLKSFIIEFGCTVLNILLYPFQFFSKVQQPKCKMSFSSAIPVIFVHGYLHNQTAWFWFTRHLQKRPAIGALYSINLFLPFASISELGKILKVKIKDIQIETGSSQVILIGHSMGGIVCSYFCEYLAKPNEVAMVITLGSPFKGTRVAALGFGQNAKEMSPNSPFLSELAQRIQESKVPYYSIASKIDNIVIPWQSALLSKGSIEKNQLILEDAGHLRLLISSLIIEQVARWISTAYNKKFGFIKNG